jgi:Signal peptide peptidase.
MAQLLNLLFFCLSSLAGNGSKEQLPMVIKVPKIIKTALSICERPYSLLGFGDILLPGNHLEMNINLNNIRGII